MLKKLAFALIIWVLSLTFLTFSAQNILTKNLENCFLILMQDELEQMTQSILYLNKKSDFEGVKNLIGKAKFFQNGYFWLINKKGEFLAYSETQRIINPNFIKLDKSEIVPKIIKKNQFNIKKIEGQYKRLAVYKPINSNLFLALILPYSDIFPWMYAHNLWDYLFFLLILGVFYFVFIFKSHRGFIDLLIKVGNKIIMGKELNLEEEKKLNKLKEIFNKLSFIIKSKRERELNDISKLPGNKELEEILYKYIDSKEKFAVALVNINNLTSYNHKYGFEKGDSVIRLTSIIIINKVKEFGNKEDFIAHLGSDQFVFITTIDKVDLISKEIIQGFDEHILFFYEKEDREKGYILSKNRKGEIIKAQVINLSVAACTNGKKPLIHPFQIGQIIKEIGEYLKQERGSGYLKDRRLDER